MSSKTPVEHRPIIHRGMAWDTKFVVALFTLCMVGPATQGRPSFWLWVVTGIHFVLLIAFYFAAKHVGVRMERERREAAYSLNQPAPVSTGGARAAVLADRPRIG